MKYICLRIPGLFPVCLRDAVFTGEALTAQAGMEGGRSDVGGQGVLTGATDLPGRDLVRA